MLWSYERAQMHAWYVFCHHPGVFHHFHCRCHYRIHPVRRQDGAAFERFDDTLWQTEQNKNHGCMELRPRVGKITRFEQLYIITSSIMVNLSGVPHYMFF